MPNRNISTVETLPNLDVVENKRLSVTTCFLLDRFPNIFSSRVIIKMRPNAEWVVLEVPTRLCDLFECEYRHWIKLECSVVCVVSVIFSVLFQRYRTCACVCVSAFIGRMRAIFVGAARGKVRLFSYTSPTLACVEYMYLLSFATQIWMRGQYLCTCPECTQRNFNLWY